MRKNPAKKTITNVGMRKATSSDGIVLPEPPDVITKLITPKKRTKKSDNNKKTPPNIQRKVYFAPMLKSIVLPDPFEMTLPLQTGAKLFRDQRRRYRNQNWYPLSWPKKSFPTNGFMRLRLG